LTIQKGDRKVRVPFVLADIAVPKIDKTQEHFDVPASAEDVFVEAETVPANDPILAGLKLTAKADWRPWQGNVKPPGLAVQIGLEGRPVEQVSAFGEFDIESALDESGNPLDFPSSHAEMQVRSWDCDSLDIESTLQAPPPVRKISQLRGSLALQLGGPNEIIVVKDFLRNIKKDNPLDNAALKTLGIVVTVEHERHLGKEYAAAEAVRIHLEWKQNAVVLCTVCDEEKLAVLEGNRSLSRTGRRSVSWWQSFKEPLPPHAQLRLCVRKLSRKIRVPFLFKDIEVPPKPTEEDTNQGTLIQFP
jgi:hypothetical protein